MATWRLSSCRSASLATSELLSVTHTTIAWLVGIWQGLRPARRVERFWGRQRQPRVHGLHVAVGQCGAQRRKGSAGARRPRARLRCSPRRALARPLHPGRAPRQRDRRLHLVRKRGFRRDRRAQHERAHRDGEPAPVRERRPANLDVEPLVTLLSSRKSVNGSVRPAPRSPPAGGGIGLTQRRGRPLVDRCA